MRYTKCKDKLHEHKIYMKVMKRLLSIWYEGETLSNIKETPPEYSGREGNNFASV